MRPSRYGLRGSVALVIALFPTFALAHGFEGDRFFPPTITTDDPFATDELLLPAISVFKQPGRDGDSDTRVIDFGFEFDKEILPKLALGISDDYLLTRSDGAGTVSGWDDIELSVKYQLWESPVHEAIVSIGLVADVGGTGYSGVGADQASILTPTIYFGKGFGDLPDSLDALKPLAITGTLGQEFPTRATDPNAFDVGLAVEYSLPYLQSEVKDVGIPAPFKDMIPVVEFNFSSPENHDGGFTTGTVNPGVMWETPDMQLGFEAIIPINEASGTHVGFIFQMQIFIDDIFPKVFGHPLFGR